MNNTPRRPILGLPRTPPYDWSTYERRKQEWIRDHPNATSDEYEDAMRDIARQCGL